MNRPSLLTSATLLDCVLAVILLATGQWQARAGRQVIVQLPQWGPDIQVNPTPTNTPYHPLQLNPSLAVNPANMNDVIAGWESFQSAPTADAYEWSTDQGLTWSGGRFDGPWDPGAMTPNGNVTVGFDAHGTAYYATAAQGSNIAGYFVLTTTNGIAWGTPHPVVATDFNTGYNWGHLAVDQRVSGPYAGSLYMFWLYTDIHYPNYDLGVRGRYSRDGGQTWSADMRVSDPNNLDIYYPFGTVASDGTVYAAFEELDNYVIESTPKLYLVRSTDGGQTWGTNYLITGDPIVPIGRPDYKNHELTLLGSANCSLIRINHYPMIAASPTDPDTVYVVWNDGRWQDATDLCGNQGRHSDVAFSRTTDGGVTWQPPARINDDAANSGVDHFQPNIAVRPDGLIGVTWLDRRYDPDHYLYDLAYGQSTDGGLTWSANQRVSDSSSDPDQLQDYKGINTVGYRRSLVYGSGYVLPSWVSAMPASNKGNFVVDHGILESATSTTIPSVTPSSTPTSTSTVTPSHPTTPTPTSTPTATSCTVQFTDVQAGSTFYTYVRCLACHGIVSGYPCGGPGEPCDSSHNPYFRPNNNVTRGQIAKIVALSAAINNPVSGQSFEDVPPGSTFYTYTEQLYALQAMNGYACGGSGEPCVPPTNRPYFRPFSNATRGQLAKIDSNAAGYSDVPTGQTFEDVAPGTTFYTFTQRLTSRGVMNGYACGNPEPCVPPANRPYFRPNANVTRGQTSKIASNTFFPNCQTPAYR